VYLLQRYYAEIDIYSGKFVISKKSCLLFEPISCIVDTAFILIIRPKGLRGKAGTYPIFSGTNNPRCLPTSFNLVWRYQIHSTNPAYHAANSLLNDTAAKSNAEKCHASPCEIRICVLAIAIILDSFPLPAIAEYLVFFITLYDKRIENKSHNNVARKTNK